jgi:hypothetical protein
MRWRFEKIRSDKNCESFHFSENLAGVRFSVTKYVIISSIAPFLTASCDGVRSELNHIVMWFADPNADNACFAPQTGPITPFDGDGQAGAAALSSKNFLPGAPLP